MHDRSWKTVRFHLVKKINNFCILINKVLN